MPGDVGLSLDTAPYSDCRKRFAEFGFSDLSKSNFAGSTDLKGLAPAGLMKDGAGLPGVPLPAVRGLSRSSRPALEPLRFKDCVVG